MDEVSNMPDYKSMYFRMFSRITDAINELKSAQQEGEEAYLSGNDEPIIMPLPKPTGESDEKDD
jgi:hypothetical protein